MKIFLTILLIVTLGACSKHTMLVGGKGSQASIDITATGGKVMATGPFAHCQGKGCENILKAQEALNEQ